MRLSVLKSTAASLAVPVFAGMLLAGCTTRAGELTAEGITAIRTACPTVAVPATTGDITLFDPPASVDQSGIDVSATLTKVRATCSDVGENVSTLITFDVQARRTKGEGARDVVLPYFVAVLQGGTVVLSKRVSRVALHFDDGQLRASTSGQATANVLRSAATLPPDIRKLLTRPRKAGNEEAAVDPLARPNIRAAVQRATFEALVGFQLTNDQLKYNATR
jgi:hypothetical protein